MWCVIAAAAAFSLLPTAAVSAYDRYVGWTDCVQPSHPLAKGDMIHAADLTLKRARRDSAPRQGPTRIEGVVGKVAHQDLPGDKCVPASALTAAPAAAVFLLSDVTMFGTATKGKTVDVSFLPVSGQDNRNGASIDGAIVHDVNNTQIVIQVTKAQLKTVLEYSGRSKVTMRAH